MNAVTEFQPGTIVRARGREWIVLPESDGPRLHLRSLGGADEDVTVLYEPLEKEPVEQATFPLPEAASAAHGSHAGALLLRDALLLKLRAGAGPFRSLGKVNVEPRAYQLVPLLMALKQEVVRLLIADDVGIGKTIEAGLIAREMLDRGEIRRFSVLCPPHLCEQWQEELQSKFNLRAEIVSTANIKRLERGLPTHTSVFTEYPFTVVSLDFIKSNRRRDEFQNSCPEFVIVDEAHTCVQGASQGRHQRYLLLRELAANVDRHLVLLTATPHSGNEDAYFNLLGLLHEDFQGLKDAADSNHPLYKRLGDHFVQRRRVDIKEWQDNTRFPDRETAETSYNLTGAWGALFNQVLDYARELVAEAEGKSLLYQRMNWWAALALLRCISSSPAAARRALETRLLRAEGEQTDAEVLAEVEALGDTTVLDGTLDEGMSEDDIEPGVVLSENADQLKALIDQVNKLTDANDPKLQHLVAQLKPLLKDGFRPVIFCRYIATAKYVAEALQGEFGKKHALLCITGEQNPAEREERISALAEEEKPAILVATDCLSEGINLQEFFDAVIHYDLSWNPTRHEQREGRVDRFGQRKPIVRALMFYGADNPVDGAVLQVILRKADSIRKALGVSVPMPEDESRVTQAIMQSVLLVRNDASGLRGQGLALDFGESDAYAIEKGLALKWDRASEKASTNRTIFAQRALKPEQVIPEFERVMEVLGDHKDVARFVTRACRALNSPLGDGRHSKTLPFEHLPEAVRDQVAVAGIQHLRHVDFDFPPAPNAEYIHRTHPLVSALADQIAEEALKGGENAVACRAAAWYSPAVSIRTLVLILRLRSRLRIRREDMTREMIAEEAIAVRIQGQEAPAWLSSADVLALMAPDPVRNMPPAMQERQMTDALAMIDAQRDALDAIARGHADQLLADHRRVREAARARGAYDVSPQTPVDVVGAFVLLPAPAL